MSDDLMRIRQRYDDAITNKNLVQGQLDQLHASLKKKYKIKSIEEARELLDRKRKQIEAKERKLAAGIEQLKKALQ